MQRWLLQRWYYVKLTHIVAIQMHFTSWNQWQCLNMSKIFIYKWRYALFFFENTYLWKMIASFSPYCCHLGYYFSNNLTAQKVILKCHIWTILFCHFYKWKMVEYIASINEIYVFWVLLFALLHLFFNEISLDNNCRFYCPLLKFLDAYIRQCSFYSNYIRYYTVLCTVFIFNNW